jgi:G3E family GTPase
MKDDYRSIVNLLTDQIEFANVIILNKTDIVTREDVGVLKSVIQKLNGEAKIIESSFGKVPLSEIMNTGLFDFDKTSQSAGWIQELNKDHTPETEEYGISSFVFRDKRPFHPVRFWNYLNQAWHGNIIRSKGLFWIASRKNEALNWSQAGGSLRADKAGVWWSSMSFKERISYAAFVENQQAIESKWDKQFGDRENELVIIGQDLDKDAITGELQNCLCTESEIRDMEAGLRFKDPFPI